VSALEVRPAGRPLAVQENGAEPPVTMMSHAYSTPTVAAVHDSGSELAEGSANDDAEFPLPQPDSARTGTQKSADRRNTPERIEEIELTAGACLLGFIVVIPPVKFRPCCASPALRAHLCECMTAAEERC